MTTLHMIHPSIEEEFPNGKFAVAKTDAPFSTMAIDQTREQNNGVMKGDGGAIGLIESPAALRRWMVAGPEMVHLIHEFESEFQHVQNHEKCKHHEQIPAKQKYKMLL